MAHVQIPPISDLAYRHLETGPSLQIAVADSFDVLGRRAVGNRLGRCGDRNCESKRECNQTACLMQHLSDERCCIRHAVWLHSRLLSQFLSPHRPRRFPTARRPRTSKLSATAICRDGPVSRCRYAKSEIGGICTWAIYGTTAGALSM